MPINNIFKAPIRWNIDSHEWYPKMQDIDYVYRLESVPLEQIEKYVKIKKSLSTGEKVVCINNFFRFDIAQIELNKIYKIYEISLMADFTIWIKISENSDFYPYQNHFISLKKIRKEKLKKIINE